MTSKTFFLTRFFPVIFYCGLIFYFSSLEKSSLDTFFLFPGQDKVIHFFEYGVLAILLMRCFPGERLSVYTILFSIFLATLYGVSDEYHQSFVPGRQSDLADILADCMGATVASIIFWVNDVRSRVCATLKD